MLDATIEITLPDWIANEVDGDRLYADDEARMGLAIQLARRNVELGTGGPFGAAIFNANGALVAVGVNRVVPHNCSVAHAETVAYMAAQARLKRCRINEDGQRYIMAASGQPCAMCYGATFWAGVDEVLIGARSSDVMELTEFDEGPLPADWVGELERRGISVRRDVLRQEACDVLKLYSETAGRAY